MEVDGHGDRSKGAEFWFVDATSDKELLITDQQFPVAGQGMLVPFGAQLAFRFQSPDRGSSGSGGHGDQRAQCARRLRFGHTVVIT